MTQYLLLIAEDETGYNEGGSEVWAEVMAGHQAFSSKWGDKITGGNALEPAATATTVRADGSGGFSVTDAPLAELKEVFGGYYEVDAADLDEAIAMAKDVPAKFGCVEVRPVMVFD